MNTFPMENHFCWQQPSAPIFDADGRIQPLNCKKGEIANRIITVGDPNRAILFVHFFDEGTLITRTSNMILTTYTGKYHGVPVSVVATGMGFCMVDLLIVQARAVIDGPMYVIRFGTCGSLHADVPIGCFALNDVAYGVRQDYESDPYPYEITKTQIKLDETLRQIIYNEFTRQLPQYRTVIGPGFSADTFYGSQGRLDPNFINNNQEVIPKVLETDPMALNFEMETYVMAFLGEKFPAAQLKIAAICITLAQRTSGLFLSNDRKHQMEQDACSVLLDSIIQAQ